MNLPSFYYVFAALMHPRYCWRAMYAISKETGVEKEEVQRVLDQYMESGLVVRNPMNEEHYGWRDRVKDMAVVVQATHQPYCKCCGRPMPLESGDTPTTSAVHQ